jgi:hypothetical protein
LESDGKVQTLLMFLFMSAVEEFGRRQIEGPAGER